jgi:hypothetical protein
VFEAAIRDRPRWWQQIADQFRTLRRDAMAQAALGIEIECREDFDQVSLLVREPSEPSPILTVTARCEEEDASASLSLTIYEMARAEEVLRLVWYEAHGSGRREQGRGLNCTAEAAAGMGMTGALKLFGVGVAFGVEIAAATFGFGAWLKAGWEGLVYALTGVGLIGGGLAPITSGRSRQMVMKVAVAWSLGVAALTAQNPKLIEPLQDQMRVFHRIDPDAELHLRNARSRSQADEERKAHLEADLKAAQAGYLGARRSADETRRDFRDGERKRDEAVKALQRQLEQQELVVKASRDELERAGQAWQGAVLSDWTRYAAAGILFALSAIVGALGPIYLGLWLDERKKVYSESLATRRVQHGLKTRTRALETNESTQRAEIGHIIASMRAYYADLLVRQSAANPQGELQRAFGGDHDAVDVAVRGFRRARGLKVADLA